MDPSLRVGREFGAQRREGPRQVRGDCTRRDAEHFSSLRGIEIQEDPQRDDLALAGREPLQHGCQFGVYPDWRPDRRRARRTVSGSSRRCLRQDDTLRFSAVRTTHARGAG